MTESKYIPLLTHSKIPEDKSTLRDKAIKKAKFIELPLFLDTYDEIISNDKISAELVEEYTNNLMIFERACNLDDHEVVFIALKKICKIAERVNDNKYLFQKYINNTPSTIYYRTKVKATFYDYLTRICRIQSFWSSILYLFLWHLALASIILSLLFFISVLDINLQEKLLTIISYYFFAKSSVSVK